MRDDDTASNDDDSSGPGDDDDLPPTDCDEENPDWTVGLLRCDPRAGEGYTLFAPLSSTTTPNRRGSSTLRTPRRPSPPRLTTSARSASNTVSP